MKKLLQPKYFISIGVLSVMSLFGASYLGRTISQSQVQLYKVNSGLGICQQRIAQTFTALMIKQIGSEYLQQDFRQMTSECLGEVSEMLESTTGNQVILGLMNNLKSDFHWFDQKLDRVVGMIQKEDIDVGQSNIVDKFSELEDLGSELENTILAESSSLENSTLLSGFLSLLSFFLLGLVAVSVLLKKKLSLKEKTRKEEILVDDVSSIASLEYALDKFLPTNLLNGALETLHRIESERIRLEDAIIKLNTEGVIQDDRIEIEIPEDLLTEAEYGEEKVESTHTDEINFHEITNLVLDKLRPRLIAEGVILETDTKDEFEIYGEQENIQQLIYSLVNYSIDSLSEIEDKRIKFVSKPLGGVAYCKVVLEGHHFTEEERAVLSGQAEVNNETSINLSLLRELINDSGLKFAVKNRQNSQKNTSSSEIEIIFERVMVEDKTPANQMEVVKGSKADIRRFFDQQLS